MKASIAIRSHKRVDALCEAIERIVTQDYPDLEIVVVEQSGVLTPSQDQRLAALQSDPRLRVYKRPPLGAAAARNEAVRLSRGDVIVFLDDDDLPRDNGWLSALMRNFDDPKCLGASGRHVVPGGRQPPYLAMQYARRSVLSYSFLKWPRTYVRVDTRSPSVQSLMGTNGSVRRSAVERFGLWDECTPIEEEASFCYRLLAGKREEEYLVFDPEAVIERRLDLPGGLDKRAMTITQFAKSIFTFFHNIIGHYHTARFVLFYPFYVALLFGVTCAWVVDESRTYTSWPQKIGAIVVFFVVLPFLWTAWLLELVSSRVMVGAPAR